MMTTEEIIGQKISKFPPYIQQEVLDFVEFLESKITTQHQETEPDEEDGWEVFLTLEKDAPPSQISDISTHVDQYLYQK